MEDLLVDDGFEPCRDERCKVERLHAAHPDLTGKRSAKFRKCPLCAAPLFKLPHKRGGCSDPKCGWRGSTIQSKQEPIHA